MDTFDLYKDIQCRTNGEIYLGVVGPVRSGKSTFIKRFMDVLVLPKMTDEHAKERTVDELPQSASGKSIMTTEPKFVPKEAAEIQLANDVSVLVRLIDCVGYMVEGAAGHMENGAERLVKTPWNEKEIPFTKAAEIGTKKVIHDHSTIDDRRKYRRASQKQLPGGRKENDPGAEKHWQAVRGLGQYPETVQRRGKKRGRRNPERISGNGTSGQL